MAKGTGTAKAKAKVETHEATIVDQYDLQEGEMLKQQVADKLNESPRNVMNRVSRGELKGTLQRKRVHGKLQEVLVFMEDDVDQFIKDRDKPKDVAASTAMAVRTAADDRTGLALQFMAQKLFEGDQVKERDPFIWLNDAVVEYGLAAKEFQEMIEKKELRAFTGRYGRVMLSRKQIENL